MQIIIYFNIPKMQHDVNIIVVNEMWLMYRGRNNMLTHMSVADWLTVIVVEQSRKEYKATNEYTNFVQTRND